MVAGARYTQKRLLWAWLRADREEGEEASHVSRGIWRGELDGPRLDSAGLHVRDVPTRMLSEELRGIMARLGATRTVNVAPSQICHQRLPNMYPVLECLPSLLIPSHVYCGESLEDLAWLRSKPLKRVYLHDENSLYIDLPVSQRRLVRVNYGSQTNRLIDEAPLFIDCTERRRLLHLTFESAAVLRELLRGVFMHLRDADDWSDPAPEAFCAFNEYLYENVAQVNEFVADMY